MQLMGVFTEPHLSVTRCPMPFSAASPFLTLHTTTAMMRVGPALLLPDCFTRKVTRMKELRLVYKNNENHRTVITLKNGATIGARDIFLAAGPCTIENESGLEVIASHLASLRVSALRGGAFKPRTSPYDFGGLGVTGLEIIAKVSERHHLAAVTEVLSIEQIAAVAKHAAILQVGSRNMQNFELLRALGSVDRPVLLKRGFAATINEFLCAAEYVLAAGNPHVILCERGVRGFDTYTRNVLDLASVAALRQLTHLPVVVDPSHATGRRELILPMARAAIAAGADGLLIECHPTPDLSISDAAQTITLHDMSRLVHEVELIASAMGRTVHAHDKGDQNDDKHVICHDQKRERSTHDRPHSS